MFQRHRNDPAPTAERSGSIACCALQCTHVCWHVTSYSRGISGAVACYCKRACWWRQLPSGLNGGLS